MSLDAPGLLVLLLVVAMMAVGAVRLERWRRSARRAFAGPQASRWRPSPGLVSMLLFLAAAGLIVFAIARPQWGSSELRRERQGIDFVIVLDVSLSMQATDAQPSRLALAQEQLVRLVEAERGNRFGLVLFAGTAIIRSPLTSDAGAMAELINRADNETGLVRTGSDIGAALDNAALVLAASESAGKAVLVVSDGEDFGGTFADKVRALRESNVLVLTAGTGTTAGSTLIETTRQGIERVKLDDAGRPVITRLNEGSLRAIAEAGRGRYLHLSGSNNLLGFREDLAGLARTPLGAETQQVPLQRFQIFVAVAFVLLMAAWFEPLRPRLSLLPVRSSLLLLRRLRPDPAIAMLALALVAGACSGGDSLRDRNQDGNAAFERGSFQEALDIYQGLIAQRPDIPELSYNAGNALHRAGLHQRAVEETQRALPPTSDRFGAITYYALGNHYLALREYELAYDAFRNSLLLNPKDRDAKHNLEVALLLLTGETEPAQPDQQPQPGEQPGSGDGEQPGQPGEGEGEGLSEGPAEPGSQQTPPTQPAPTGPPSAAEVRRLLQDALRGINDRLTFEEAVRILDLLQQQQEGQRLPGGGSAPSGPDY